MKPTIEFLQHIQSTFNHNVSSCYQCMASFTRPQLKLLCNKTPFNNLRIILFVPMEWCVKLQVCKQNLKSTSYPISLP